MFNQLSEQSDDEYAMLDATIVKAHQHSAGKKGIKPSVAAKVDCLRSVLATLKSLIKHGT
jgi:hypothetical protein